jgi:hydrogenase expression/formation protein HypD
MTAQQALQRIRRYDGPPLRIMEGCGTHTAAIARAGLRSLLPEGVRLVSGPGCPVCVTEPGLSTR